MINYEINYYRSLFCMKTNPTEQQKKQMMLIEYVIHVQASFQLQLINPPLVFINRTYKQ